MKKTMIISGILVFASLLSLLIYAINYIEKWQFIAIVSSIGIGASLVLFGRISMLWLKNDEVNETCQNLTIEVKDLTKELKESNEWEGNLFHMVSEKNKRIFDLPGVVPVMFLERLVLLSLKEEIEEKFLDYYADQIVAQIQLIQTYQELQQLCFKTGIDHPETNMFVQECEFSIEEILLEIQLLIIDKCADTIRTTIQKDWETSRDGREAEWEQVRRFSDDHIFKKLTIQEFIPESDAK